MLSITFKYGSAKGAESSLLWPSPAEGMRTCGISQSLIANFQLALLSIGLLRPSIWKYKYNQEL